MDYVWDLLVLLVPKIIKNVLSSEYNHPCGIQTNKRYVTVSILYLSADKILQDEMDVVSYRVLAYLLLGVVRIYSKKVEYLFDDCNEVLIKINKFVSTTKDNAQVETLRMSITIPDRLELDAFNLDILEDADSDG